MPVNKLEFKQHLAAQARAAGAVAMGVCRAAPLADASRLSAWISEGRHAAMAYLEQTAAVRVDPRRLVPGARSVIVVAIPYALSRPPAGTSAGRGAVPAPASTGAPAAMAVPSAVLAGLFAGQDYHQVVGKVLAELASTCLQAGGHPEHTRVAVDTQPLLERSLAVQAGLGRIGRSTQLLVPGVGSRVTLGVLLTDLELPPDAPATGDPCGDCTACLQACPAGALAPSDSLAPGLDAARCLSYATTASREEIPEPLRALLGPRLYGCDTCQQVCPHNQCPPVPVPIGLQGDTEVPLSRLHAWAGLSGRALRRVLAGTAMSWLPPRILLQSLAVVLGNLGRPESEPVLARLAREHRDPAVRHHAAWALARMQRA